VDDTRDDTGYCSADHSDRVWGVTMGRPKPIVPLGSLEVGQHADCFVLLAERKPAVAANGKPYFSCRFRDNRRAVTYMVWSDGPHYLDCEKNWRPGKCYKLRCVYFEHDKYGPQVEIQQIREATDDDTPDGFDPLALVERSRGEPAEMFKDLRALVKTEIDGEPLRRLVLFVLDKNADRLHWLPASHGKYYPFAGGWLEHTLSVTNTCLYLAAKYRAAYPDLGRPIDRDLLVAGAVLHDIGRVGEFDGPTASQSTVAGELVGHLFLGRDVVRDAAREVPDLNPQLLQLLEHLIVSHLNLPAWGSPRLPAIPESLILHHADDLDAKVEMFARCLTRDVAAGPFTDKDPVLGRPLYKGTPTAAAAGPPVSPDGTGPGPRS
jgi:3'-5' exoribonuclease